MYIFSCSKSNKNVFYLDQLGIWIIVIQFSKRIMKTLSMQQFFIFVLLLIVLPSSMFQSLDHLRAYNTINQVSENCWTNNRSVFLSNLSFLLCTFCVLTYNYCFPKSRILPSSIRLCNE
jgi:hypothetical protein